MRKKLFVLIIIILSFTIIILTTLKNKYNKKNISLAGSYAKDFILGMKNSAIYKLTDFLGKYNIILAFLDTTPQSQKVSNIIKNNQLKSFLKNNKDIIWFNISKDDSPRITIEEKTDKFNLSYRTLLTNIPETYNFKILPTIIIITKSGIIHLVYSGYSPTLINDILDIMKSIKQ